MQTQGQKVLIQKWIGMGLVTKIMNIGQELTKKDLNPEYLFFPLRCISCSFYQECVQYNYVEQLVGLHINSESVSKHLGHY